jgi:hypothetical protein
LAAAIKRTFRSRWDTLSEAEKRRENPSRFLAEQMA